MPRYFFHTQIGEDVISDPTGIELRDPDAAGRRRGRRSAPPCASRRIRPG
jgi:hypothetical protein